MQENVRFNSWIEAAKSVGLVYMSAERFFFILSFLDFITIWFYICKKASGSIVKADPFRKDIFKLFCFVFTGIFLPIVLKVFGNYFSEKHNLTIFIGLIGCYNIINVIQYNVNVIAFDKFRGDRLPIYKSNSSIFNKLEKIFTFIIPYDKRTKNYIISYYKITSGPRRFILSIMDFWVLLVGYSLVYWSLIPEQFTKCLNYYPYAIYYSIVCGVTLGFGDIAPTTEVSMYITALETLTCFLFALVIIANAMSLLPKPPTMEKI